MSSTGFLGLNLRLGLAARLLDFISGIAQFKLTETGDFKLTETGDFKILELENG
jgi:hypothetical protein